MSTPAPQRLGVFGGAFDPPHLAHVALAQLAVRQLQLDQLRVLPTGQAWHKPRSLSAAAHRLAMARLAFAEVPQAVVDDREVQRAGPTYTVDTLRELAAQFPGAQLFLLMGEDQAVALPTWHEWREVVRLAIICVAEREGAVAGPAGQEMPRGPGFTPPAGLAQRFIRLQLPAMHVSATDIRSQIAHEAAGAAGLAPMVAEPVARYIALHHLYQTA